ncbi:cytochrome P450 [Trametes versicolor FP-101664 SS1]|uniref:cytochrome P450 n=1 Tax=Trametes versicolor (strain FP-101664) TaxID=717944 RepID=UPI00046238EB|nr:cytochrome P450 [Trametes versicolor FP-101664 SS1]EIW57464.1 cytochrome P450 [Trametes versicolor FP-101664 SS1]
MSEILTLFATIFLYGAWKVLRNYFVPSVLDNIPGPKSTSVITGNAAQLFDRDNAAFLQMLKNTYGPISMIHAFLGTRWLHVYDVKAMHTILVKDQELYNRSDAGNTATHLILGPGLLATEGLRHKRQRKMLNPVFSAAHMRNMTPFFHEVVGKLREAIDNRVAAGAKEIDITGWMGRTALELVGQGGLGHSFDPLTEETSDEYTEAVKALVCVFVFSLPDTRNIVLPFVKYMGPAWLRRKMLDLVPIPNVQRMKHITDLMHERSIQIFNERKAAALRGEESMLNQVAGGKDVMSVLLKANLEADDEDRLPEEELIAQMSTFILAGVDTTSNALARILHLLALHPDVQDKLRAELVEAQAQYGEKMPYNELSQLPYMDAVCRETMRIHTPVSFVLREALEDTKIPVTEPIRGLDDTLITEIAVPKGTFIFLNSLACNGNKALWGEDADEWKPERWLAPLPRELEEARIRGFTRICTYLAANLFWSGFKFSQLEMKVVLSTLVRSFKFDVPEKPITWNFSGVNFPTMDGPDKAKPEMFLKIQRVEE